jgi:hypothetical protein
MTRARTLAAAALAAGLLVASQAAAAPVEDATTFFLRSNGCGTTQEPGRLSTESGAPDADSTEGCGFIGGVPLDEAVYQAEGSSFTVLDFTTEDGVPLTVDAERDVEGVFATRSWTGGVGGIGEVVADITFYATRIGANGKPQSVVIGQTTASATALPTSTVYELPFAIDVPEALQGVELRSLTLSVALRGANWNASALKFNGSSYVAVPTLVDDGEDDGEQEPTV